MGSHGGSTKGTTNGSNAVKLLTYGFYERYQPPAYNSASTEVTAWSIIASERKSTIPMNHSVTMIAPGGHFPNSVRPRRVLLLSTSLANLADLLHSLL